MRPSRRYTSFVHGSQERHRPAGGAYRWPHRRLGGSYTIPARWRRSTSGGPPRKGNHDKMSNGSARLVLCVVAVLLLALATGADCIGTSQYPTVSGEGIDFAAKTYRGQGNIVWAGNSFGLTDFLRGRTIGEEGCLFTLETDWDVQAYFPPVGTVPLIGLNVVGLTAEGGGGYADPGLNPFHACNTYQFLAWTFRWQWNVGGKTDSRVGGLCYNIRGAEQVC